MLAVIWITCEDPSYPIQLGGHGLHGMSANHSRWDAYPQSWVYLAIPKTARTITS